MLRHYIITSCILSASIISCSWLENDSTYTKHNFISQDKPPQEDNENKTLEDEIANLQCTEHSDLPSQRLWRLSESQIKNSLLDIFSVAPSAIKLTLDDPKAEGLPPDATENLSVNTERIQLLNTAFENLATLLIHHEAKISECVNASGTDCVTDFLDKTGQKLWRRLLTQEEQQSILDLFTNISTENNSRKDAMGAVIQVMLLSPHFLYRSEVGEKKSEGIAELSNKEIAEFMSFTIWNGPPDEKLLEQVSQNTLKNNLEAELKRLLEDPKAARGYADFMSEWLDINAMDSVQKDTDSKGFDFNSDVKSQLKKVSELDFLSHYQGGSLSFSESLTKKMETSSVAIAPLLDQATPNTLFNQTLEFENLTHNGFSIKDVQGGKAIASQNLKTEVNLGELSNSSGLYDLTLKVKFNTSEDCSLAIKENDKIVLFQSCDSENITAKGVELQENSSLKLEISQSKIEQIVLDSISLSQQTFQQPQNEAKRMGILTHPAFLAAHSHEKNTGIPRRASYVLGELLCSPLSIPDNIEIDSGAAQQAKTTREFFEKSHSARPECAACHKMLDPSSTCESSNFSQ